MMDDSLRLVSASICIALSVLSLAVNGPTVANILMRPALRTTLNEMDRLQLDPDFKKNYILPIKNCSEYLLCLSNDMLLYT